MKDNRCGMDERQRGVQESATESTAVNREKIEAMVELEHHLLTERSRSDTAEQDEQDRQDDEGDRSATTGTIRTAYLDDGQIQVKFFADRQTWTDTIPMPDDPNDPSAAINRLCRLCGVPEGRIADLQSETVPIQYDASAETYDLIVPATFSGVSRVIFHVWWWLHRHGITLTRAGLERAGLITGLGTVYLLSMRYLLAVKENGGLDSISRSGAVEATIPGVSFPIMGLPPVAEAGLVVILSVFLGGAGFASFSVTVTVGVMLLCIFLKKVGAVCRRMINATDPFVEKSR